MMGSHHHLENNLDHPFVGVVGSSKYSSGGGNDVLGNIYCDDYISSSSIRMENCMSNSSTDLQPFDIFAYSNTTPGMGFPFTSVQWKELQRQAMVYKCMISPVPVPPDLLFPLSESSAPLVYNGRYSKNGDPEPGRCKRTDGKKWRCAKDVAPHQKYCERHLHRGRPRSRKPVEVIKNDNNNNNKKTSLEQIPLPFTADNSQEFVKVPDDKPLLLFNAEISATPSYKGTNRNLGLMLEGEMVPEQQWKNYMGANTGFTNEESSIYSSSAPIFHQDDMNLFSYSSTYITPEFEAPTEFIDAWSLDNLNSVNNVNTESTQNHGNLSPALTLSMAMPAGNALDEEMGTIQVEEESGLKVCVDQNSKDWKWASPVSWDLFTRGGPLAEALHPGSVPASPYYDSISSSNPTTAVSSPSGVLHRTLFSHSDGSVCNSPTRVPAPPSEIAFQWLN